MPSFCYHNLGPVKQNHPSALIFGNAFFHTKLKLVASEIIFENFTSISQTIVKIYSLELKHYKMAIFEKSHFKVNVILLQQYSMNMKELL